MNYTAPLSFEQVLVTVAKAAISSGETNPHLRWSSAAGANEAFSSEGGFLLPSDTAQELIDGVADVAPLYEAADKQPITKGNALKLPAYDERSRETGSRFGGLRLYWPDEADQVTASIPKFRSVDLLLNKLMGSTFATSELFEDVPALAAILRRAFTIEAGTMIEEGMIDGPGASQMLGVLRAGDALITVIPESGQPSGSLQPANVTKMFARMWPIGQRRMMWLYNAELTSQIFALNSGGLDLVTFGADGPQLMGRPLIAHEACKAPGAVGDLIAIDPESYVIGSRPTEMAESMAIRFIEHEAAFRFSWRIAGSPGWATAVTPRNGTQAVSPFVTLGAR